MSMKKILGKRVMKMSNNMVSYIIFWDSSWQNNLYMFNDIVLLNVSWKFFLKSNINGGFYGQFRNVYIWCIKYIDIVFLKWYCV